jgi:hypothetical protein
MSGIVSVFVEVVIVVVTVVTVVSACRFSE